MPARPEAPFWSGKQAKSGRGSLEGVADGNIPGPRSRRPRPLARFRLDCETEMSTTNGRVRDEEPNVATSFAGLAHDVIELGELQTQLFVHDVKSTTQKTRTSFLLGVVGACVLLGSVPVLLFALGELIAERTGWPLSAGLAIAAVIGIAASAGFWRRVEPTERGTEFDAALAR